MRLPDKKEDRIKLMILAAVGIAVILYGGFLGVIKPYINRNRNMRADIEVLSEKLGKTKAHIQDMIDARDKQVGLLRELVAAAGDAGYFRHPTLGNYILDAQEELEKHALTAGVTLGNVQQVGIYPIPKTTSQSGENAVKAYAARVSLQCGTHQLIKLLHEIETHSPYLCVSSIAIKGQPTDPSRHNVSFDVQWPAWADTETGVKLAEQLAEAESFRADAPAEEEGSGDEAEAGAGGDGEAASAAEPGARAATATAGEAAVENGTAAGENADEQ